jgi:hypothetical protein
MHDPMSLPLWIGLLPLAGYLLVIATAHVRSRSTAVTGSWDLVLLATAVAGLGLCGPLAALQPSGVTGGWRWALPLVALGLLVAVAILVSRPRLIFYNLTGEQLRPAVAAIATELDPGARWAGETVALPDRGLQVHLDGRGGMRTVSLVAVGSRTSPEAWTEFSRRIRHEVATVRVRPSPWAGVFTASAAAVLAVAAWLAWQPEPEAAPAASPPSRVRSFPLSEDTHAGSRRSVGA